MSQAPSLAPSFSSFADVLATVGQIPGQRVRQDVAPGTATEEDVVRIHACEKRLCELIDGVLVEKAVGAYESLLAMELVRILGQFVLDHDLGIVLGEAGMLRLFPGRVRIPDVCFISWAQLPGKVFPQEAIPALHPDLAIEVLSQANTRPEMHSKLHDYFNSGARLVWYLDPAGQAMSVYTSPTEMQVVRLDGSLDGGDVLPGLTLPLADVFRVRRSESNPSAG